MPVGSPPSKVLRAGIVGCGRMGRVHARILADIPGVTVCGFADRDRQRAEGLAADVPGAGAFDDVDVMIDEAGIDVVHVLTPPATHAALCCAALEAGCHVFVEKPMAMSRQEAGRMAAAAAAHGRLLTVDHNNRFDPVVEEAQRRVAAGRIGDLIGVDVYHNSLPPEAPWVSRLPSGDWFNDFDHLIYLSECFLGAVRGVKAVGVPGDGERVAELHVAARNDRGYSALTYSTLTSPFELRLTLRGSRGIIEIDVLPGMIVERHPSGRHRWLRKGLMNLDTAAQILTRTGFHAIRVLSGREKGWGGLRNLLARFYAAAQSGGDSPVALETCLRIVDLKQDILEQVGQGRDS